MRRLNNKDAKTVEKSYFDAAPVIRTYFNDVVTVVFTFSLQLKITIKYLLSCQTT